MADENPAFGRKVFVVCPSFAMRSFLITKLIENEYETYIIDKHVDAKNVLAEFPDSICFINIDEDLSHEAWFNFIKSCETEDSMSSILFGVFSTNINKALKKSYMEQLNLKAGFVSINENMDKLYETVVGILDANGAKGRRQYVRASCASNEDAFMLAEVGTKAYKLSLLDISVVGAACGVDVADKDAFKINSLLHNVSFSLDKKTFTLNAVIFSIIQTQNFCKLILLFIQPVPKKTKQVIRNYISATLQNQIRVLIENSYEDETDYTKLPTKKSDDDDDDDD